MITEHTDVTIKEQEDNAKEATQDIKEHIHTNKWPIFLLIVAGVSVAIFLVLLLLIWSKSKNNAYAAANELQQMVETYSEKNVMEAETQSVEEMTTEEPVSETVMEEMTTEEFDNGMKIPDGFTEEGLNSMTVTAPVDYSLSGAVAKLKERGSEDARYTVIVRDKDKYPEKLLINLANNPELLSFVYNYPLTDNEEIKLSDTELAVKCPLFLQWDKRWGYLPYGDNSNIAISGCGPTALAMVVVGLTKNAEATPDAIADFAMNNDFFMYGTGTMWKLMTDGASHYGLYSEQIDREKELMDQCLLEGGMLICSVGPGDFTPVGHFIVIYDNSEEGYVINDPFCIHRSNQKWTYEQLRKQMKAVWALKNK